ncbi:hypothetical protein C1645_838254, partial [Glomus cerebriforme]
DDDDDDTDDDNDDDQLPYRLLFRTLQVNDDDNDEPLFDNTEDILEEESSDFRGFDAISAYEDLAKILTHLKFQKEDVSTNIRQIYKWRDRLPLAKVHKHDVPILRGVVADEMDNNMLKLKINQLLSHKNLLNCRSTDNRHSCDNGKELWLVEGEAKFINPANIE